MRTVEGIGINVKYNLTNTSVIVIDIRLLKKLLDLEYITDYPPTTFSNDFNQAAYLYSMTSGILFSQAYYSFAKLT